MARFVPVPTAAAFGPRSWSIDRLGVIGVCRSALGLCFLGALAAGPAHAQPAASKDEAAAISLVAASKAKAGEFALCASLYQQAYRQDPSYLAYLFSAARCAQKDSNFDAAERDYRAFLARSPATDPLVEKARTNLDEILGRRRAAAVPDEQARPPASPAAAALPPAVTLTAGSAGTPAGDAQIAPPLAAGPAAWPNWAWLAGGTLAVAGGGWLVAGGVADRAALSSDLAHPANGLIVGVTPSQAHARDVAWRTSVGAGAALAIAGAAAASWGGWQVWRGSPLQPGLSVRSDGWLVTLAAPLWPRS